MKEWEKPFEDGTKGACWCCKHLYEDEVEGGYWCFFGRIPVCIRDDCTQDCRHNPPKFKCIKSEDETFMIRGKDRRIRRYDN